MSETKRFVYADNAATTPVDERVLEILKTKQEIFDKFADESVVAQDAEEMAERAISAQIIEEEKKRLGITD